MPSSSGWVRVSTNTRFVLWSRKLERDAWELWLVHRTGWQRAVVAQFLRGTGPGEHPSEEELLMLTDVLGLEGVESLALADLVDEGCQVLRENLAFLIGGLPHGGKRTLAKALQVNPTTISRWLGGSSPPGKPTQRALVDYFGLPRDIDLATDPVFLSVDPLSAVQKLAWVHERVQALDDSELHELFPALHKLLGAP